ncbi:MAG: ABC transporter substrate-binding protein [Candidatus Thalassarchaeaceae archaeon]
MIASALAGCLGGDDDDDGDDVVEILGCTYADANNYNSEATKDDGSCEYDPGFEPVDGCTNPAATNYNSAATRDDGSCTMPETVMGCMDEAANNYNSAAEADDGSCDYGMAQGDIMAAYASGEMAFSDAWYNLSVSRKCRDLGTNNPCEMTDMTIGEADTHDPADAYDSASGDVISNVYDTLYRYEGDGDGGSIIVPRLATGHSVSADGLTYTFDLRDDVYFSNGDHMTSTDAVYSWCRVIGMGAPSSGVNWILTQSFDCNDADGNHDDWGGERLNVIDDYSFSVEIYDPSAAFVATIAYTVGSVINSALCEANRVIVEDDVNTTDVDESSDDFCHEFMDEAQVGAGTNAYMVSQWARGTRLVMEPNWMYWEESDFNLNRVVVDLVEETQTRVLALQDGEVDRAYIPSAQKTEFCNNMEDLPNANGKDGFRCTYRQTYSVVNVPYNFKPKADMADGEADYIKNHDCNDNGTNDCNVLSISEVRQALSYTLDYDTIHTEAYKGELIPIYGPIPTGFPYDDTQYEVFTYDLEYAETILDDAGFIRQYDCASLSLTEAPTVVAEAERDGTECRLPNLLRILTNTGNDQRIAVAQLWGPALESIGIANDNADQPWATVIDNYIYGKWDLWVIGWGPDYLDPDNYWSPFAGSADIGGDAYHGYFENDALDEILLDARKEQDSDAREDLYADAYDLWVTSPTMALLGQYAGVGVGADHMCPPAYDAIGGDYFFNWDKLAKVSGSYIGEC